MSKKVYVVARNYQEFLFHSKGKPNRVYIESPISLKGLHGVKIIRVGQWWLREDLTELAQEIRWAESK